MADFPEFSANTESLTRREPLINQISLSRKHVHKRKFALIDLVKHDIYCLGYACTFCGELWTEIRFILWA